MAKRFNKKEMYAQIYSVIENSNATNKSDLLGFVDREVELLEKKSARTPMTATQKANLAILDDIREVLAKKENAVTISDLIKEEPLNVYTSQKISALMKKLVDGGEVEKTSVKKVSYFRIKQ